MTETTEAKLETIDCQSCGATIETIEGVDDHKCRGCGIYVCQSCVDVFEHVNEGNTRGAHGTGDPAEAVKALRTRIADLERERDEARRIGKNNLERATRIGNKTREELAKWRDSAYAWAPMGTRKGWDREAEEAKAAAVRHLGCGQAWIWDNDLIGRCGRDGICGECEPGSDDGKICQVCGETRPVHSLECALENGFDPNPMVELVTGSARPATDDGPLCNVCGGSGYFGDETCDHCHHGRRKPGHDYQDADSYPFARPATDPKETP